MPRSVCKPGYCAGFTLVELILAIGISALIAVAAYAGVRVAVAADEGLRAEATRLYELQRALNIIEEDLSQIRPRSATTAGGVRQAAFKGGVLQRPLLAFTRAGVPNPAGLQRSELQRVEYVLEDGRLWRRHRWVLDGADAARPADAVLLLENVVSLRPAFLPHAEATGQAETRLLDDMTHWLEHWDSALPAASPVPGRAMPMAIMLTLELEGFGRIHRVIELP